MYVPSQTSNSGYVPVQDAIAVGMASIQYFPLLLLWIATLYSYYE